MGCYHLGATAWVSASAGVGYKSLVFDSGTTAWSTFHSNDWHYNIYYDVERYLYDTLNNYRAYWTL